jgi:hypothetical protein
MQQDEPFPLKAIPPWVRQAIIREFQGRWPTVQEVAQISDSYWLTTPDIGPSALEKIHSTLDVRSHRSDDAPPRWTDAELLDRLARLQKELRRLKHALQARIGGSSEAGLRSRGRAGSALDLPVMK